MAGPPSRNSSLEVCNGTAHWFDHFLAICIVKMDFLSHYVPVIFLRCARMLAEWLVRGKNKHRGADAGTEVLGGPLGIS